MMTGGATHVFYSPLDAGCPVARLTTLLSAGERNNADRFRFARDRNSYVAAHALLRIGLHAATRHTGWTISSDRHGKPMAHRADGHGRPAISLSHSVGMTACAVAWGGEVGVDVEGRRDDIDAEAIARRYFTHGEYERVRTANADRHSVFFSLWTLKEAIVKALGRGLTIPLSLFDVVLVPPAVHFSDTLRQNEKAWRVETRRLDEHFGAMARIMPDQGGGRHEAVWHRIDLTAAEVIRA